MSSAVKKIRKRMAGKPDPLYNSLIGSIISTVSILTGHTTEDARKLFLKMRRLGDKLPCNTVRELCDYVYEQYGFKGDDVKPHAEMIILITDNTNVRTPMVTFVTIGGDEDHPIRIMPVDPKGFHEVNILSLAVQGRDWAEIEYVYEVDNAEP